MFTVIEGYALPVDGDKFETKEEAIDYINSCIWTPSVTYVDEYTEPKQLKVRWFEGKLYYRDIILDQRYVFNTYEEASAFKEDFHIKIRKLWKSLR